MFVRGQKRRSTAAVQTLRAARSSLAVAKRLDCGGFSTALAPRQIDNNTQASTRLNFGAARFILPRIEP
jgi:hypothetical protein